MNLTPTYTWNRCKLLAKKMRSAFLFNNGPCGLLACHFDGMLQRNFPPGSPFSFIQVGAHDGVSYDNLYGFVSKRNARGLVIEPLPDIFIELKKNYAFNKNITPLNVAVHASLDEITLYRVDPARLNGLPEWAAGIGSLDPLHHKKTGIPSEIIVAQQVPARPLMDIIYEHHGKMPVNLFQVDVEGFDYEVLQLLDFKHLKPDIVKMEYINLSTVEMDAAIARLREAGYYCLYDHYDVIGIQLKRIRI